MSLSFGVCHVDIILTYIDSLILVYLRADPQVCYERIMKRSRKEESGVPYVSD